ncbi:hypothetical protein F4781DRAFT_414986 [Annulohypoxylon bovei var. microspora]|nr:hypothetical protein F4781DRAFT_414986 [Annulohypoxylon bovei var. microspora]
MKLNKDGEFFYNYFFLLCVLFRYSSFRLVYQTLFCNPTNHNKAMSFSGFLVFFLLAVLLVTAFVVPSSLDYKVDVQ